MAYTPRALKDLFRASEDDAESPGNGDDSDSLWSDAEIYSYMDFAQQKFAELTWILVDSTSELTQIDVTTGEPWVSLDPRILKIKRARLETVRQYVTPVKFQEVDECYTRDDYGVQGGPNWEDSEGDPEYIITNMEKDMGRLVPIPVSDDTLQLVVARLPLRQVTAQTPALEITDTRHQLVLLDGMRWMAYLKQDADVLNVSKSAECQTRFMQAADDVKVETQLKTSPGRPIRYGGL